jgi:hypothetical protein
MRHQPHSTLTPAVVQRHARQALQHSLDWKAYYDSVSVGDLLDLVLLMAATAASLFATVRRFFPFSHETAARALKSNLPAMDRLVQGLVGALYNVAAFSRQDQRRRWRVAIDTHYVAYYGQPGAAQPYIVGGPKKQGTKSFFGYATACLLHRHRRYTVALCPLPNRTKPHAIVRTLLDQIAAHGLRVGGVALDSAFDSGDTLLLLQERGLAYVVPLRRKGAGRNARNRCFEGRHRLVRWFEWTTEQSRRRVRTRTLLWHGSRKTMVFAFQGWAGTRARNVHRQALQQRQLYRRRFGIETSYRQKNQAQAFTASRDPVYRLLLQGVAYLLRQVWVVLSALLARDRPARAPAGRGLWTMALLLDWLAQQLAAQHPERRSIPYGLAG